jgi:hypothetical protein
LTQKEAGGTWRDRIDEVKGDGRREKLRKK